MQGNSWNSETYWTLECDSGAQLSAGSSTNGGGTPYQGSLQIDAPAVCTLTLGDIYGDGWVNQNGSFSMWTASSSDAVFGVVSDEVREISFTLDGGSSVTYTFQVSPSA